MITLSFFGAPSFSADVLEKIIIDLSETVTVSSVFTQPDRPAGRKQILTPTPVKLMAQKHNIPVFTDLLTTNYQLPTTNLALLYAYGQLLPPEILKIPPQGFWNIHPSLLPLYRGPSPITYPLLFGEKKTGVSLIEMDERMDHGPILAQKEYQIQNDDTQETLRKRLSDIGYELFKQSIQLLRDGKLQKKEQDHSKATFTRLLTKQDGFIPFEIVQKIIKKEDVSHAFIPQIITDYLKKNHFPLSTNYQLLTTHLFRALSPWPGLWTLLPNGKRLKITQVSLPLTAYELPTTNYSLPPLITHVQLEGKKEVDIHTFLKAYPLV